MTTFKKLFLNVIVVRKYLGKELSLDVFKMMDREILGSGLLATP